MNECTIICLLYCLMCFTEFVPNPETRRIVGFMYIAANLINILIHTILLWVSSVKKLILVCKKYYRRY